MKLLWTIVNCSHNFSRTPWILLLFNVNSIFSVINEARCKYLAYVYSNVSYLTSLYIFIVSGLIHTYVDPRFVQVVQLTELFVVLWPLLYICTTFSSLYLCICPYVPVTSSAVYDHITIFPLYLVYNNVSSVHMYHTCTNFILSSGEPCTG